MKKGKRKKVNRKTLYEFGLMINPNMTNDHRKSDQLNKIFDPVKLVLFLRKRKFQFLEKRMKTEKHDFCSSRCRGESIDLVQVPCKCNHLGAFD